jgi:membrane protease YdiL (CAAX protease family)
MAASESSVRVQEALSGESATSEAMAADAGLAGAEGAAASAASSPSGAYILAGLAVLLAAAAWRWRLASLPGGIGPRRRILPSAGCLLIGAMLVAGAIGSGFGAAAAPSGDLPAMAAAMAGLVGGQLVLLPLVAAAFRSNRFAEASSAASLPAGRAIAIGVLAMVAAYPAIATLGNGLQLLQTSLLGDERSRIAHETLAAMVSQPASLWTAAMMLLVVVGVPLCEEIAYRGLLQPAIGGLFPWLGRLGAIAVASTIFALLHLPAIPPGSQWGAMGMLVGVGMVLGWTYERTGRLRAAVAGHALFNAGNIALAAATA